ncbi:hypothetical protein JCM8547_000692 [Rhodosporidiobolus lusitaniae]
MNESHPLQGSDLQRSLLASISSSLPLDRDLPSLPSSSPASPNPAGEQDNTDTGYQDGDLPDFSDPEDDTLPSSAAPSSSGPPRLVSGKALKGPGGARTKGKVPLSALKNRIQTGATKAKAAVSNKPLPPPPSSSSSSSPAIASLEEQQITTLEKGKGKSRALKLKDSELDAIAAKIASDNPSLPPLDRTQVADLLEQLQIDEDFVKGKKGVLGKGAKDTGSFKFWRTQPVVSLETKPDDIREGPLEADKPLSSIPTSPIALHKDFEWVTVNLSDPGELKEVYELLTHHYVEDQDASFRFDYSPEFIEWALKPPGYVPEWHVGIRVRSSTVTNDHKDGDETTKKGKLIGFIAGVPMDLRIRTATKHTTEINFLVVHKKLRSKRLAPLLIQEVTRRTHLKGVFQAIYTAGAFLPTPVSRCQYYHRNLSPAKLVKLGFSAVPRNSTVARMATYYRVPTETTIPGLRELEKRDLKQASRLLRAYLARFDMAPLVSNKEVEHALWAGRGREVGKGEKREGQVVWTYVVEDPTTHRITDLFSFYSLPSTAIKHSPPTTSSKTNVNAAYLYYYASTAAPSCADLGDGSTATPVKNWKDESEEERERLAERLKGLMGDALVVVQRHGFDVLNTLTLQDNALFLDDLKFGKGDGFLHFYLYNYATKPIAGGVDPKEGGSGMGVVML